MGIRLLNLLTAIVMVTCLNVQPAHATEYWENDGWWNNTSDGITNDESGNAGVHYTYPDYPLNCNTGGAAGNSVRMVFVRLDTAPGSLFDDYLPDLREIVHRWASVFAASNGRAFTPVTKLSDRTPKIMTYLSSNGTCQPAWVSLTAPYSVLFSDVDGPGGLFEYLKGLGYDSSTRKYMVLVQRDYFGCGGVTADGCSEAQLSPDPDPATNPDNVGGSISAVAIGRWGPSPEVSIDYWRGYLTNVLSHEFAHNIGAANTSTPHSDGTGHVSDEGDVLFQSTDHNSNSYMWSMNSLPIRPGAPCTTTRSQVRLDCLDDDYWNPNSPAWQTTRWNTYRNSFLWGN